MEYTTALSTISELPSNKEQMATFFRSLKSEILDGNHDPLEVLKQLKYAEKVIADILTDKDIEYKFLREAILYKEKTFEYRGAKYTVQEVGTKYDYKDCGDPVWFDLKKQSEEINSKLKEREDFLKVLPQEGTVDPTTGVFINRPSKTSKEKVTVRL